MRGDDFEPAQREHLVRTDRDYLAFVPPPLPPKTELDTDLVSRLSEADRALGELAGIGRTLPSAPLLAQSMVRREAVLSSRIEGTQATMSDLALFEVEQDEHFSSSSDVAEVMNYVSALNHVLAADQPLPISLRLLREAHQILLTGVRGEHATPGEFRRSQNWIGPPGCMLDTATYVPPPPEQLWECLDSLEKFLHSDPAFPPLISIACAHYQFEAIHPFIDGNGRVGRLLVTQLLVDWGLLPAPLLDLSAYLEPHRDVYYARLLAVSTNGDWLGWITFFLDVFANQATDARNRAIALHHLREDYRARVTSARASSLLPRLVDALFATPAMTINRAKNILDVTHRAATQNVEKLVTAGMLTEISSPRRTRLFLAHDVLRAVNGQPPSNIYP